MGTALAAAVLPAPAQASRSGTHIGHPVRPVPSLAGAARTAALDSAAGVITGVVAGAAGRPLTGVCVIATGPGGSSSVAMTRSDGRYTLGGLSPGGYTLHYSACAAGGSYADQWTGGASWPNSASVVNIARGQSRELSPVTLRSTMPVAPRVIPRAITGLISGTTGFSGLAQRQSERLVAADDSVANAKTGAIAGLVTGGGKPLKGVCVAAEGPTFKTTLTSKAGKYQVNKLRPGRYIVFFTAGNFCGRNTDNWLPQYYKNVNGPVIRKQPTRVRVTAGQTTNGIDAALRQGGQISGTVRSQGGKTVARVCVLAEGHIGRTFAEGFTVSNKDGGYALHSLFPGKYTVVFIPGDCGSKGNFIPQWWRNSPDQKHAVTIAIIPGRVVRKVDAALRPGAVINGVVRAGNSHGALLSRICVDAQPTGPEGEFSTYGFTTTGKDGSYHLTGLITGKYAIFFSRDCGNNGNFLPVRRTLSVVAGHTTSGFDAFLPPGAIITGKVTGNHGVPVGGICVQASGRDFRGATTKKDGTYSIVALDSGHYSVEFSGGCGNSGSYAPQYYKGQDNIGSATKVIATAGSTTSGINAALKPGGTITGVLTDSSGKRVTQRVCVELSSPALAQFGYPFSIQFTNKGVYTARNLVPGVYAVDFGCFYGSAGFASQWFMGAPGSALADYVSAPAGVVTSGISAVLRRGGSITGTVTNSAGKPVSGLCVQVTLHGGPIPEVNGFFNRDLGFTNSHGVYRIDAIAAAKYDVQFGCFSGSRYASQWYRGTASRASATAVTVTNKVTTTGINAVLTLAGSMSGEAMNGANQPQGQVCVTAYDAADNLSGFAETNKHGLYTINHLASAAYEVRFSDCGFGRHHIRLGNAVRPGLVTVTAPHAVTGVNEKLFPAGSISGIVRGGAADTLQADACVVAVPISPNAAIGITQSGSGGGYRMASLAPGKYQVYFGDPFCFFAGDNYAPQWFNNQAAQATATTVTVTSGHDTSAVSATLASDGAITGTVTSHSSGPVTGECVTATPVDPVADPLFGNVFHPVIGVTAAGGGYALVGLPPGKYTVKFSVGCGDTGFQTQWWHHARSAADATIITVSANGSVTGIDAVLRHPHHSGG